MAKIRKWMHFVFTTLNFVFNCTETDYFQRPKLTCGWSSFGRVASICAQTSLALWVLGASDMLRLAQAREAVRTREWRAIMIDLVLQWFNKKECVLMTTATGDRIGVLHRQCVRMFGFMRDLDFNIPDSFNVATQTSHQKLSNIWNLDLQPTMWMLDAACMYRISQHFIRIIFRSATN
jgi:hypothetical protein